MGACADGILISQRSIKPLEIPRQTGVILHRDGKETLTIWNTVQAEASQVAWVLPLPAVPEVIQQTDPAAVRLLQMVAAPQMIIRRAWGLGGWIFASIVLTVGIGLLLKRRPLKATGQRCGIVMVLLLIWIILSALFASYGSVLMAEGAPVTNVEGVRLLAAQEVGNYDTTVVSGDSAEKVNGWLSANGFMAFTENQAAVVHDYLSKRWVFLCVRLKVSAAGLTAVHPLTVRFAS